MDLFIPICIMILIFITCSICGYCCKRNKQGIVYGVANPPTVTTHTEYNVSSVNPPNAGFVTEVPYPTSTPYPSQHTAPYPPHTAPYPPASCSVSHGYQPMPMPMPVTGGFTGNTPYPPMPMPGSGAYTAPVPPYPAHIPGQNPAHQLPPSYAEAVTQPPPPTANELYAKQSPYNPNYN